MSRDFIKIHFGGKKGVSGLALYYLSKHSNEYVPLQVLANFCECTPRAVIEALGPYIKHPLIGKYVEEKSISKETGTKGSHLYRLKSDDNPNSWPSILMGLFEIAEKLEG